MAGRRNRRRKKPEALRKLEQQAEEFGIKIYYGDLKNRPVGYCFLREQPVIAVNSKISHEEKTAFIEQQIDRLVKANNGEAYL